MPDNTTTGVDADLATLRRATRFSNSQESLSLAWECKAALARVEAELSRLREERDAAQQDRNEYIDIAEREGARCAQLEDDLDRERDNHAALLRINQHAAGEWEARCARLQQALNEVRRWFHTMPWLGEPDPGSHGGRPYSAYEVGTLGYGTYRDPRFLPEALAGPGSEQSSLTESGSAGLPDTPTHRKQNVEYWRARSRVAEAECARLQQALRFYAESQFDDNGDIAREALAGPDTLTAGEPGVEPDGTARVAPADGCAERQSTANPSPAASAGPDTPADSQEDKT